MLSEEDEVALIVKRDGTSTVKLRIVRKQSCKQSRERATESCVEVVQYHFWEVSRHVTTPLQS